MLRIKAKFNQDYCERVIVKEKKLQSHYMLHMWIRAEKTQKKTENKTIASEILLVLEITM